MRVSRFRNSLSSIPHLLAAGNVNAAGWGNCRRPSPIKKAARRPLFPPRPAVSDVVMLDFRDLGRVVVMAGATVHPAGEQVVENAHDRQQQQQEDQVAADAPDQSEQPQDDEDGDDRPDQTGHEFTSLMAGCRLTLKLIATISSIMERRWRAVKGPNGPSPTGDLATARRGGG